MKLGWKTQSKGEAEAESLTRKVFLEERRCAQGPSFRCLEKRGSPFAQKAKAFSFPTLTWEATVKESISSTCLSPTWTLGREGPTLVL